MIQIPARCCRAAILGTGYRVGGNEFADMPLERRTRRSNDITLGRTAVGHDGVRTEIRCDTLEDFRHLGNRRRHEDDVGIADFMRRIDPGPIDDAQFLRLAQGSRRSPETDHLLDRPRLLETECE
ncbi:hypothetical protein SDC9_163868 [bioreactor metagenome]|uniref:Uncharacterized protein n=1 Tax=bioreactor metagenome TaxID=1076179 RepID=A0A645FX91_9ZZZZ